MKRRSQRGQTLVELAFVMTIALTIAVAVYSFATVLARWEAARVGAYSLCEYIADTADVPDIWSSTMEVDIPVPLFTVREAFPPADGSVLVLLIGTGDISPYADFRSDSRTLPDGTMFAGYRVIQRWGRPVYEVRAVECRLMVNMGAEVPLVGWVGVRRNETFVVASRWH